MDEEKRIGPLDQSLKEEQPTRTPLVPSWRLPMRR